MRLSALLWLTMGSCRIDSKGNARECILDFDCPDALLCVQNQCASVECYSHMTVAGYLVSDGTQRTWVR